MRARPQRSPARDDYYSRIAPKNLAPLWEVLSGIQKTEPQPREVPTVWHYEDIKSLLLEAGSLITAREADRRVLMLENPAFRGTPPPRITHSLFAGLQLIMPGEIAPAHRHTQSALRFIIEGSGAYTAVDGERTTMKPGDFVITPAWTWHDHGNETDTPVVWLDGLDIPIVDLLNVGFFEGYPEDQFPVTRPEGDSAARYGSGILPVDYEVRGKTSPILNYAYEHVCEALEQMSRRGDYDECHGIKMRYVNPATGDWAMPTIGTSIQRLAKGFNGNPYRSTDGTVFSVVEGSGRTLVGDQSLDWRQRDVFIVPSWKWYYHQATDESVLFSFSDRPLQEKIGLFREQRGKGA